MRILRSLALRLWLPAVLLLSWFWLSQASTSPYFPPLSKILRSFVTIWFSAEFFRTLVPSVLHLLAGFGLAVVMGLTGGIVMGLSRRAARAIEPFTEFFRAMPIAAMVPIGLVALGPGAAMETALIAFGSCWPILVATTDGIRGVDPVMIDTARIYGLNWRQRLLQIVLPAALPQVASGLRIAIAISVATMLIANMFGSSSGLGYFVILAQQSFDILSTWAGLLMIGIIGALFNGVFVLIQRRVLAWHRGWRQ